MREGQQSDKDWWDYGALGAKKGPPRGQGKPAIRAEKGPPGGQGETAIRAGPPRGQGKPATGAGMGARRRSFGSQSETMRDRTASDAVHNAPQGGRGQGSPKNPATRAGMGSQGARMGSQRAGSQGGQGNPATGAGSQAAGGSAAQGAVNNPPRPPPPHSVESAAELDRAVVQMTANGGWMHSQLLKGLKTETANPMRRTCTSEQHGRRMRYAKRIRWRSRGALEPVGRADLVDGAGARWRADPVEARARIERAGARVDGPEPGTLEPDVRACLVDGAGARWRADPVEARARIGRAGARVDGPEPGGKGQSQDPRRYKKAGKHLKPTSRMHKDEGNVKSSTVDGGGATEHGRASSLSFPPPLSRTPAAGQGNTTLVPRTIDGVVCEVPKDAANVWTRQGQERVEYGAELVQAFGEAESQGSLDEEPSALRSHVPVDGRSPNVEPGGAPRPHGGGDREFGNAEPVAARSHVSNSAECSGAEPVVARAHAPDSASARRKKPGAPRLSVKNLRGGTRTTEFEKQPGLRYDPNRWGDAEGGQGTGREGNGLEDRGAQSVSAGLEREEIRGLENPSRSGSAERETSGGYGSTWDGAVNSQPFPTPPSVPSAFADGDTLHVQMVVDEVTYTMPKDVADSWNRGRQETARFRSEMVEATRVSKEAAGKAERQEQEKTSLKEQIRAWEDAYLLQERRSGVGGAPSVAATPTGPQGAQGQAERRPTPAAGSAFAPWSMATPSMSPSAILRTDMYGQRRGVSNLPRAFVPVTESQDDVVEVTRSSASGVTEWSSGQYETDGRMTMENLEAMIAEMEKKMQDMDARTSGGAWDLRRAVIGCHECGGPHRESDCVKLQWLKRKSADTSSADEDLPDDDGELNEEPGAPRTHVSAEDMPLNVEAGAPSSHVGSGRGVANGEPAGADAHIPIPVGSQGEEPVEAVAHTLGPASHTEEPGAPDAHSVDSSVGSGGKGTPDQKEAAAPVRKAQVPSKEAIPTQEVVVSGERDDARSKDQTQVWQDRVLFDQTPCIGAVPGVPSIPVVEATRKPSGRRAFVVKNQNPAEESDEEDLDIETARAEGDAVRKEVVGQGSKAGDAEEADAPTPAPVGSGIAPDLPGSGLWTQPGRDDRAGHPEEEASLVPAVEGQKRPVTPSPRMGVSEYRERSLTWKKPLENVGMGLPRVEEQGPGALESQLPERVERVQGVDLRIGELCEGDQLALWELMEESGRVSGGWPLQDTTRVSVDLQRKVVPRYPKVRERSAPLDMGNGVRECMDKTQVYLTMGEIAPGFDQNHLPRLRHVLQRPHDPEKAVPPPDKRCCPKKKRPPAQPRKRSESVELKSCGDDLKELVAVKGESVKNAQKLVMDNMRQTQIGLQDQRANTAQHHLTNDRLHGKDPTCENSKEIMDVLKEPYRSRELSANTNNVLVLDMAGGEIRIINASTSWSGKFWQEVNAIRQYPEGTFRENIPSEVQQPHEHRYETKSNYRQISGSGRFEPATNTNSQGNWHWSWNRKGKATWARKNKGKASWARQNKGNGQEKGKGRAWNKGKERRQQGKGKGRAWNKGKERKQQGKGKGRAWNKGKERNQQGKGKGRDWRRKFRKLRQEFQDHWIQEHNGSLQGWKKEWGKWRQVHNYVVSGKADSGFSASKGAMKKLKQKFKKYFKQHKGSGSWQWAWRQVKNEKWTTSSRTPEWMEDWFKSTGVTGSNGNENETENGSETDANESKSSSSESDSESKSKSSKSSSGSKSKGKSHSSEHTSKESSESGASGSSSDSETSSSDTDGTEVEGLTQEDFRQIFRSMQGSDENWEEAWNLWLEEGGGSEETVQTWIKNLLSSNGGTENGNLEELQDRFRAAYRHEHKNSDEGWETAWQAWLLERDGPGKDMNRWVERWVSTNGGTENQEKENRRTDVSSEEFRESYAELHHGSDKGWQAAWKDWLNRKTEPASLSGWIDEWISINEGEIHHKYSGGARHGSNSEGGTVQIISGGDFSEGQKSHGIDGYTGVLVDPRLVVDYGDGAELQQVTSNTVNLAGGAKTHVSEHSGSSHENSGKVDVYTNNLGAEGHGGATIKGDGDRVTEQSSGLSGGIIDEGNEVQTEIGGVSKVNGGGGQTGEKTGAESQAKSAELEVLGSFVPEKTDATDKSEETTGIESSVDNHSGTETGFEIGGTRTGTHSSSLGGRVSGQLETTNNFGLGSSSGWATDGDSHSVRGSASAGGIGGFESGKRVDGQIQGSTGGGEGEQGGATWSWENGRWINTNEFWDKDNVGGQFGGSANVMVDHKLQTGSAESSERTGQAVKEVSTSSGENGGFEGGRRVDGQSQGSTGGGKGKQGGATWSWENRRWNEFGGNGNAGGEFGGSANVIVDHKLQTGSAESSERTGQAVKEVSTSSGENGGFEGGRRVDGQSQGSTGGGKGKQGGATWSWENRRWNEFGGKGNAGGEFGGSANVIVDHKLQTGSAESSERTGQAVKEVSTSSGENGGFEGGRRVDGQSQGSTGGGKGKQGGATWSWENRRWNEFGGKGNPGGEFGGSANVIVDHKLQTGSAESSERTGQAVKEVSTSSGENGGFEGGRRVDGQSQGSTGGGKGKQGGATWSWENRRWNEFGGKGNAGGEFGGSANVIVDHKLQTGSAESSERTGQAVKEVSTSSGENGGFEGGRRVDGQSQGSTGGGKGKQGGATWSWENRRWNEFGGKGNAGGEFGGSANVIVDHKLQTGSAESSERTGQAVKEVSTSSGENGGFEGGRRVDGQRQGSTGGGKGKQDSASWLWRNGRWIRVKHFGGKGSTGAQFEGSAEGRQDHKWKKESAESRGRTGQGRWSGGGSVSGSSSGRYEGEIEWPKRRRIPNGGKETFGEGKEFHKHKSGGSSSYGAHESGFNSGRYGVNAGLSLGSKSSQRARPTFVGGKRNVDAGSGSHGHTGESRWSAGGNVPVSAGQNYGWESEWYEGRNGKSKYKGGYNGGYESEISTGGWTYGEHGRLLGEGKFRGKSGALAVIKGQKCFIPHGHYHTEGGEIVIDRSSSEGGGSYSGASGYRIGSKTHELGAYGESGHEYKAGLGLKAGANGGMEGQYGSSASGNLNAENQSGGGSGHAIGASVNFGGLRASAGFGLGGKSSLGAKSGGSASTRHKYRWSGATRSSSLAQVGASGGIGCGSNDFMCKVTNAVKAFFS